MSIGSALFLITVGAILRWGVTDHPDWIDLQTAGLVIFVIGLVGLCIAIWWTFLWARRPAATRSVPPAPPPP